MLEPAMTIRVDCYAGYKGEETPRRLFLGDRLVEVAEVLDRWLAPDHSYFKVMATDGTKYIVRRGVEEGRWELIMFERPEGRSRNQG